MRGPDHDDGERQANGGSGGNPAADLLWRLISITVAAMAAVVLTTCLLG